MKTVAAIYTGQGLAEPLGRVFKEQIPGVKLVSILDDSLIAEVIREGGVTPGVERRLVQYYQHAVDIGADVILNTCSSVGEVADAAREKFGIPIVKIDEWMAKEAVERYETIAVLATLPTTLNPTKRLIERQAAALGKKVTIIEGLAAGAFEALGQGNPAEHDRILFETAIRVADQADVLVLAQGSMARMEQTLAEKTGKPVLSSPHRGVLNVKQVLEG